MLVGAKRRIIFFLIFQFHEFTSKLNKNPFTFAISTQPSSMFHLVFLLSADRRDTHSCQRNGTNSLTALCLFHETIFCVCPFYLIINASSNFNLAIYDRTNCLVRTCIEFYAQLFRRSKVRRKVLFKC